MSALDQAFVRAYGQPTAAEAEFSVGLSASTRAEPLDATETPVPRDAVAARTAGRPPSTPASAIQAKPVESTPAPARKRRAAASREKASAKAVRRPSTHESRLVSRFRPLLEVDTFLWPRTVGSLAATAAEALDQLTGNLLDHAKRGQKAIGWQSCRHGDGCSTLLLAVARRLAEQDLKVAAVDADFRHPRLARRLGLTPSEGWEEAAAGHVPLAEVIIESLRDGIVLVPWCGPAEPPDESFDLNLLLKPLRENYDHVMVDLGHDGQHSRHAPRMASLRACLDVVLVVHNVGDVPTAELNRLCRGLSKDGKAELAVVENFA